MVPRGHSGVSAGSVPRDEDSGYRVRVVHALRYVERIVTLPPLRFLADNGRWH